MTTNTTAVTHLLGTKFHHAFVSLGTPAYKLHVRDSIKAYQQEHNLPDDTAVRELINHAYDTTLQNLDSISHDDPETYWDTYTTILLNSAAQYIVQEHPNCDYYVTACESLNHTSLFTVLSVFQEDGLHAYVSASRNLCRNPIVHQDYHSRIKTWCTQWATTYTHITLVTPEGETEELLAAVPDRVGVLAVTPGARDGYRMVREPQRYDHMLNRHLFYDKARMCYGGFGENFGLKHPLNTTVGEIWEVLDRQSLDNLITMYYCQEIIGPSLRGRDVKRHTALADGTIPAGWGVHALVPNPYFDTIENLQKPISEFTSYELKEGDLYY